MLTLGYVLISKAISSPQALALVLLHIVQRDHTMPSMRNTSLKVLYISSSLFGFFIFASYSAILTSLMTLAPPDPSIKSFQDIYALNLPLTTRKSAAYEIYLKVAPKDSYMSKVYERALKNGDDKKFANSESEALEQILAGELYYGG